MNRRKGIHEQYESWPYPHYPLLASVRRLDTWQLNVDYLFDRCAKGPAPERPRIWITGCGTFQPYTMGLANPHADILASDISRRSLTQARRRCLWHGMSSHEFAVVDLNDESTWPGGPFDFIECYGVLMNLEDPTDSLRRMTRRLSERGVLRLMVYPHYSRQRIFQVQRVARLLGLSFRGRNHPHLLRQVMTNLPIGHPLRFAFETYPDSRNEPGIVDGFLHAGDHGFTGLRLAQSIDDADLEPAFWFHRPWGQPDVMCNELGLSQLGPGEVLDYLDLWQELRTNLTVCLRRKGSETRSGGRIRLHPLLDPGTKGLPLPGRIRLLWQLATGVTLRSHIHAAPLRWSRGDLAAVRRAVRRSARRSARGEDTSDEPVVQRAKSEGVLLGGAPIVRSKCAPVAPESRSNRSGQTGPTIQVGKRVANPLYDHLFQAWYRVADDLPAAIETWSAHAEPLEDDGGFGLTPFATYKKFESDITTHLRSRSTAKAASFSEVRYTQERDGLRELDSFLARFPDLPRREFSAAELRELWILLGSHRHLFLDAEGV